MRIFRFLFIAFALLQLSSRVWADMEEFPVDPASIKSMPFVVVVENADYGNMILFRIIADPKGIASGAGEDMKFQLDGASLTVHQGADFISSCCVAGQKLPENMQEEWKVPLAEKKIAFAQGVLFEFTVSPKHLDAATFEIGYASGSHPALNNYHFELKSFVPTPDLGLVLGLKGKKVAITGILPNSPAAQAGLSAGLLVQKIDSDEIASLSLETAQKLCGPADMVNLELIDTTTGQIKTVLLSTEKIFR
jgi:membrane-associated protease RseP (regulator of RpoE activity)